MDEDRFAEVYARVLTAASVRDSTEKGEYSTRVGAAIKQAGLTRDEFLAALRWYSGDPHRWSAMVEKSAKLLEAELTLPQKARAPSALPPR